MVTDKPYKTSDTALASYLIASGFKLLSIDYSQPRFEFLFFNTTIILASASDYISGRALIEPIAFNRINKKLLRIIRNQHQWEED